MASKVFNVKYPTESASSSGGSVSYSLVELPPALAASTSQLSSLVIKGQPADDAVLCTPTTTYAIRAVQNSNSLLVCSAKRDTDRKQIVEIEKTLHQTLELDVAVPRLDRITQLLKGQEWSLDDTEEPAQKRRKLTRYSKQDMLDTVPASDAQILSALNAQRILEIDGYLRPLKAGSLSILLKNILNTLTILSYPPTSFPLAELAESLYKDDQIPSEVISQVIEWFGSQDKADYMKWCLDLKLVAKEVGKDLLTRHRQKPCKMNTFMQDWKTALGEEQAHECKMELLAGMYLLEANKRNAAESSLLYFPVSSLPRDAASRFNELFSVRPRWKVSEIAPFLADLAVDAKKRDALTLKFTRKVKGEDDGEMYYAARGR